MGSENLHEAPEVLSDHTKDMHRAIVSLMEELEAVDWYQQRAEACTDDALRAILLHNKNEEIEHAMMNLEWIRRNDQKFAEEVDTYIKSSGAVVDVEGHATTSPAGTASGGSASESYNGSLKIGSLKGI